MVTYRAELHPDPKLCIRQALDKPIGTPRLNRLARGRRNAVILISDISRLCPSYLFLDELLTQLHEAGVADEHIRIVVALGLHRKQTEDELKQLVGEPVYRRVRVVNHSALSEDCVLLGTTSMGTPVEINRIVAEAELRIATGNIEPHALVGISGGVKALVPGTASHRCIEHNHALSQKFTAQPGQPDNPIHRDLEEALRFAPIDFLFNVIVDHQRHLIDAVAGDVVKAHRLGAAKAANAFVVPVDRQYDVTVVSPGGYPKDSQLYQTVKSLKNASAITKNGGDILLVAQCQEMFGNGIFQFWIETIQDRSLMVAKLKEQFVLGAHKVLHVDEVLQKHRVHMYSDLPEPIVRLLGFQPVADLQAAYDTLTADSSKSIAVMPFGALTFPQTNRGLT
jgi:nickel-dependent lactate racemase